MPFIRIETNTEYPVGKSEKILEETSALVAKGVSKPVEYVMAKIAPAAPMAFGGKNVPTIYMEIKSVGLTTTQAKVLAKTLTDFAVENFTVPKDNVYIEFANAQASFWGSGGDLLG